VAGLAALAVEMRVAEVLIIHRDTKAVRRGVPAGEHGWPEVAALPAAGRGICGCLELQIDDRIEVM
jgi:hypothetical protein